jgi:multidrug efflux pump subunit AcrA (membrane-fusion protein)
VKGVIYVSPYNTGIVRTVNVRVGDLVKKGEALATLDPTFTQADLVTLDSPEDALVVKVGKLSPGSVYSGGGTDASSAGTDPLFTLMPVNAPLFADVYVLSSDVGFVRVGHEVRLKLDAYRYLEYGVAKGVVQSISENSFTLDDNNQPTAPYFKVHVRITSTKLRGVPKTFRLLPGDTFTGDVMVGQRTIMSYLVEGILKTTEEAMREP